jgi:hypothetical protein
MLILSMLFGAFRHPGPRTRFSLRLLMLLNAKTQVADHAKVDRAWVVRQVRLLGGKGTNSMGTTSSPEVLRLRALNAVHPINL